MNLIPYEEILYHTNLGVSEVLERMHSMYEHKVDLKHKKNGQALSPQYSGEIEGLHFKLAKKEGVNPFHPIVDGTVEKMTDQTRVDATFSLPDMVIMLFIGWAGILLTSFVYLIIKATEAQISIAIVSLPLVMLVFSYLALITIFHLESKGPKKMMDKILEPVDKE
jgi:hypothetical protein